MTTYSTNEFRSGLKVIVDGNPCSIIESEFIKPGKGQAFNRVKFRNLKTHRVLEKTFKSGGTLLTADVIEIEMQYLYNDEKFWHFMIPSNYEQYAASREAVANVRKWLKETVLYIVIMWNDVPLLVEPPNFIELKIIETKPELRSDTTTSRTKKAKLETGVVVRIPLFLNEGEVIKVDTRRGEYFSRAK